MTQVTIIDVSPRDGLQIEPKKVSTEEKAKLIDKLTEAGIKKIEAASFVHPKKVPQMADAEALLEQIHSNKNIQPIALIPNQRGFMRASEFPHLELNWAASATETFSDKNLGMTIDKNFEMFTEVAKEAKSKGMEICFSIAVSFGCPYEGHVEEEKVLELAEKAVQAGADRIGIADTIGIATPDAVNRLFKKVFDVTGDTNVSFHIHDTRGLGLANAYAAYTAGVRIFEAAVSGIGGCPFAPGSAGNLATEDLVYLFERMGVKTGVDINKLFEAADFAASLSSKTPLGRIRHLDRTRTMKEMME
ncbi:MULTISPECIES: hydroxymethylglutaryl-CoA lyase [Oceanobacillus]|uniref:Hydroxymethylglutaryl-CoA lyase n=1 Tax=Oceanobacillus aidingensis TaxID=645964 RepID=A0ABV9JYJ2_9BACI|nr:hydroxymethylglutaryl-CoA lyase [Oceanobacillus oncorhynchi]MDM8100644.1 hydroxymethylglutaryl-CoA lyase [Oceanobacillus oncorhynchi]